MENTVGIHLLVDMYGIEGHLLTDPHLLRDILVKSVDGAGLHPVSEPSIVQFTERGKGVTGMILLSESHIAFHSYPEVSLLMLDIFTCGAARPESALQIFVETLQPAHYKTTTVFRGED